MIRSAHLLAVSVVGAALLVGCGSSEPQRVVVGAPAGSGASDCGATGAGQGGKAKAEKEGAATRRQPAVKRGTPAALAPGVCAVVVSVKEAELEAHGARDVAGPGAKVTVEIENRSDEPFDLGTVVVNAFDGDRRPAPPNETATGPRLRGTLEPGARQRGVFAFRVPDGDVSSLVVEIESSDSPDVAVVEP